MTQVRVRIRYSTGGIWISPDLAGWKRSFHCDGMDVEVQLPSRHDEFTHSLRAQKPHDWRFRGDAADGRDRTRRRS